MKMRKVFLMGLAGLGLAGSLMTANVQAQQGTLSVEEQKRIGVTQPHLAALKVVHENPPKANPEIPGLNLEKVFFANAGGNRSLWRLDFTGEFPEDNSNIIFYVDTDNNPETGRKNYKGVDLMVWVENGATRTVTYTPDGTLATGPLAFASIVGKQLFMSVDADLHQKDNASVVPVQIVAQTATPLKAQSNAPFFELRGAPATSSAKAERMQPVHNLRNMTFTWGLPELRAISDDKANIFFPVTEAKMTGWAVDHNSEYRTTAATLRTGKGVIQVTAPQDGRYYPGFIYYDDTPNAAIALYVNGKQEGVAASNDNDNNQKLFALKEAVDLKKGDTIELRSLNNNGPYRIESLLLLKELFPQKANQYTYNYVAATRPWQQPEVMRLTFTTTWPAQVAVQYGTTEKLGSQVAEQTVPLNNHRLYLRGLKEGKKYFYRFAAKDRAGQPVLSPIRSFIFQQPKYPAPTPGLKTVALTLSKVPAGAAWPVSSGVPLPKGQVFQTENLRLMGVGNQIIAAQKKVLGRWTDGSIKWVLLSFLASPSQDKYQLQYGAQVRDEHTGALASRVNNGISVNTVALQWSATQLPSGAYRLSLAQGGKELLGNAQITITSADGKTYSSDFRPDAVEIQDNGPQNAVILLRGSLGNSSNRSTFFRYVARWHFQRNSALARVQIALENDGSQVFSNVKSATLRFNLPSSSAQVQLGELGKFQTSPNQAVEVLQHYDNEFVAQTPQGEMNSPKNGTRFPGWLQWSNGAQNLGLAVRNFWQLYPKALSVRGNVLEIGLAPEVEAKQFARFKGTVEEYRSVYYLMEGNYKLRQGVSFSTEVVFNAAPQADGSHLADYVNNPPVLVATPEYYRDSKAFGDIGLGNEFPLVQRYNEKTAGAFGNYLGAREKQHEFGLLNYGDWWGERGINWGNIEYDTQHAFILQFARTGNIAFLRAAADAEIHNRDVDTVHTDVNPPEKQFSIGGGGYGSDGAAKGRVWSHSIGHTGGYFKESPVERQGSPDSHFSSSHTWTEGHYDYYFLTGDVRSLEVANSISDVYDTYATINYDFSNCRVPGWTLIFTMGAYDATGDPFYLNAAHIIVDRVLERQTPDGGWQRQLVPGHCTHMPRHHGNAGFMVGVLMTGLKNYAEVTGDQRAKDSVVKAAHFMINDMWIPEAKAFRYTSCPTSSIAPGLNLLIAEGIAYAWRQKREPQLRRVTLDAMERIVEQMDGQGKNISMELRSTARQIFDVSEMLKLQDPLSAEAEFKLPAAGQGSAVQFSAKAKTLKGNIAKYSWNFGDGSTGEGQNVSHEYPNGGSYLVVLKVTNTEGDEVTRSLRISTASPLLQELNKATDVMIEAENYAGQGLGEVGIVTDRVNISGKAITRWEANQGHWLQWKFSVPEDGKYQILLKYASGSAQVERAVHLDGALLPGAPQAVVLPGTGGFSASEDNWQVWQLLGNDKKPVQVSLAKGAHTLRITNLSGGMALDFIVVKKVG